MQRLRNLEAYLERRHKKAVPSNPGHFTHPQKQSFSVQYVQTSSQHDALKTSIEDNALQRRTEKGLEWERKSLKFQSLEAEARELEHTPKRDNDDAEVHGEANCAKCRIQHEADSMTVEIDEWPLPSDKEQMEACLFELDRPPGFDAWRDTTWSIVQDLGRNPADPSEDVHVRLHEYSHLRKLATGSPRITLASYTKPFALSHYKRRKFAIPIDSICVDSGLRYRLFDTTQKAWVTLARTGERPSLAQKCVLALPSSPYTTLQWAVDSTKHFANQVMEKQAECPPEISLREYHSFGLLRAGPRLQWSNILAELSATNLTLNGSARVLLLQTAWEAGRASTRGVLRETHCMFEDNAFCQKLLQVLGHVANRVAASWKEHEAVAMTISLLLRLLSLTQSEDVTLEAISLLRKLREIKVSQTNRRLLRIAASTCRTTYNVDARHVPRILCTDADVACLIECSIIVHDNATNDIPATQANVEDTLINHALQHGLRSCILELPTGMNTAVTKVLTGAVVSDPWRISSENSSTWVTNFIDATIPRQSRTTLHYNLLSGELLVGGRPLGRMPPSSENDEVFRRVFEARVLRVSSSDMPGMTYAALHPINGHLVHLGMRQNKLIVRPRLGSRILEIIPHELFRADLPRQLVEDYVHWLDLQSNEIEFRPRNSIWSSSEQNWRLQFSSRGPTSLRILNKRLVNPLSHIARKIFSILATLDDRVNIHITMTDEKLIEVSLPRFALHFFVNRAGALESREYDAVVGSDQILGCLSGLKSKLVLNSQAFEGSQLQQSVLIPYGEVFINKADSHVAVSIEPGKDDKVRHFHYRIDTHLRKLKGPPELLSGLFKAYLHAITTHWLPDTFTGLTGTEEALEILSEESMRMCFPLTEDELRTLHCISALAPRRFYYPQHLERSGQVQVVMWHKVLSPLAQHEEFHNMAAAISAYAARAADLYPEGERTKLVEYKGDLLLLERAAQRNAAIRPRDHLQSSPLTRGDVGYSQRDTANASDRYSRVSEIAKLVQAWPLKVDICLDLAKRMKSWTTVSGFNGSFTLLSYTDLLDLGRDSWGLLFNLCRKARRTDSHRLMFLFGTLAFGGDIEQIHLRTLLAVAFSGIFRDLAGPAQDSFDLSAGSGPDNLKLESILRQHTVPFVCGPVPPNSTRYRRGVFRKQETAKYTKEVTAQVTQLAEDFCEQWPAARLVPPAQTAVPLINLASAVAACNEMFKVWHSNATFLQYIRGIEVDLRPLHDPAQTSTPAEAAIQEPIISAHQDIIYPSLMDIIANSSPPALEPIPEALTRRPRPSKSSSSHAAENQHRMSLDSLDDLGEELMARGGSIQREYAEVLRLSITQLRARPMAGLQDYPHHALEYADHAADLKAYVHQVFSSITAALSPTASHQVLLQEASIYPPATPRSLLALLSRKTVKQLPEGWLQVLITYGSSIAIYQRSERLVQLAAQKDILGLLKLLECPGRDGWSPIQYPDWLLIEIENNICIRAVQARVAQEMLSPSSMTSQVYQLNCGEGKSSVIIPMLAAALADGNSLARIVVLKPLLRQTQYLLSQRLGALLGRRIYYAPFCRKTKLDQQTVATLQKIYKECKDEGGIQLILPEQILSFRLAGRERLASDHSLAQKLIGLERWLEANCRDVLDESDELLDTRFQVAYTIGTQRLFDGHPDRWLLVQNVLSRVALHGNTLAKRFSKGIELDEKPGTFPALSITSNEVGEELEALLVSDLEEGNIAGLSIGFVPATVRRAILKFVRYRKVDSTIASLASTALAGTPQLLKAVLLLRGLIGHGLLLSALRKRWMVEYGLDLRRSLMAVPYYAKGVPSVSSEFGHPDIAIILSALSYYYAGLTPEQLRQSFDVLFKVPSAADEYASWCISCPGLPDQLRSLEGVNIEDEDVFTYQLLPSLSKNKKAVDFFLSNICYPKAGREFLHKLSTSAWDIPASRRGKPTTGFSGTNDNRFLLPLTIQQYDLPELQHTNSMVLNLLLRPENREYVNAVDGNGRRLDIPALLRLISAQEPPIHVLIDVGAQVLEMKNQDVAQAWLKVVPNATAAVFFGENDEQMVVDREGRLSHLEASPFKYKLGDCLIYLDEVHTRGMDLPIPPGVRAALTLGPRLTKDRLVQACMRMRKLGSGHALAFLAPPEVHQGILDSAGKEVHEQVTSLDVIRWSILQTLQQAKNNLPLWVMQGVEFVKRRTICESFLTEPNPDRLFSDAPRISNIWNELRENDAQGLQEMYGTDRSHTQGSLPALSESPNDPIAAHLETVAATLDPSAVSETALNEEQERELATEVEQQQQIQRPPAASALPHKLSAVVEEFVSSGSLPSGQGELALPAYTSLCNTSVMKQIGSFDGICPDIYVSVDFANSVKLLSNALGDDYLKPVRWVLSSGRSKAVFIISPHEANRLVDSIRTSDHARLHIFVPRVAKTMTGFGDFLYTIAGTERAPENWPSEQILRGLNLFAGSLYLPNYTEYTNLCHFLGIATRGYSNRSGQNDPQVSIANDGFVDPASRAALQWPVESPFKQSPLPFIKALLSLRQHGQIFAHTHMGYITSGRVLTEADFPDTDGLFFPMNDLG
ncbi:hypothetical protein W97_05384 [Coniosporium apollinis CBS 100218]|uniref:ubiquitinyl hydrolase 1 n=1 Tax=Coniosporium apollinis (strain CBS 100218) TaxID=1168221 RepID=R7YWX3_CONA1|nr:uncharacterized protein W97_05384 [Coniosporium apollinis CBS 100218]EON66141.1 hypothetical protein W97_05384 [Coniosporium apollinis CBS 100218]